MKIKFGSIRYLIVREKFWANLSVDFFNKSCDCSYDYRKHRYLTQSSFQSHSWIEYNTVGKIPPHTNKWMNFLNVKFRSWKANTQTRAKIPKLASMTSLTNDLSILRQKSVVTPHKVKRMIAKFVVLFMSRRSSFESLWNKIIIKFIEMRLLVSEFTSSLIRRIKKRSNPFLRSTDIVK